MIDPAVAVGVLLPLAGLIVAGAVADAQRGRRSWRDWWRGLR